MNPLNQQEFKIGYYEKIVLLKKSHLRDCPFLYCLHAYSNLYCKGKKKGFDYYDSEKPKL